MSSSRPRGPPRGPAPLLLTPREVDALYDCLEAVHGALLGCGIPHLLAAGSLLGAVRSQSILFCDDDVDIAVFEQDYPRLLEQLPAALAPCAAYVRRPWPAADRIRPHALPHVWVDVFVLRRYDSIDQLRHLVSMKDNGQPQPAAYVESILGAITSSDTAGAALFPLWHYDSRKALELWPAEFFTAPELLPLRADLRLGHLTLPGPAHPAPHLRRALGRDVFEVYKVAAGHAPWCRELRGRVQAGAGGAAAAAAAPGAALPLAEEQFLPMQHSRRCKRVESSHCRAALLSYLQQAERDWALRLSIDHPDPPGPTATGSTTAGPTVPGPTNPRPTAGGPTATGPTATGPTATGPTAPGPTATEPTATGPTTPGPTATEPTATGPTTPGPTDTEPTAPEPTTTESTAAAVTEHNSPTPRLPDAAVHNTTWDRGAATESPAAAAAAAAAAKPSWFGAAVRRHTLGSPLPLAFTPQLLGVMEPHLRKARAQRAAAPPPPPLPPGLAAEASGVYDDATHALGPALAAALGLPPGADLAQLHSLLPALGGKHAAMSRLRRPAHRAAFHAAFDAFVRTTLAPHLAAATSPPTTSLYYQSFPCVRVIQPGEFSLGPHCDAAYGHAAANLNVVLPLTPSGGASALHLETRPGAEDWHPVTGGPGSFTRFLGSRCLHWTSENTTDATRVSLDFRIIPGQLWEPDADTFTRTPGYYVRTYQCPMGPGAEAHQCPMGLGTEAHQCPLGPGAEAHQCPLGPGTEAHQCPLGPGAEAHQCPLGPGAEAHQCPLGPGAEAHQCPLGPGTEAHQCPLGPGTEAHQCPLGPGTEAHQCPLGPGTEAQAPLAGGEALMGGDQPPALGGEGGPSGGVVWVRDGELPEPDRRMGYPFT